MSGQEQQSTQPAQGSPSPKAPEQGNQRLDRRGAFDKALARQQARSEQQPRAAKPAPSEPARDAKEPQEETTSPQFDLSALPPEAQAYLKSVEKRHQAAFTKKTQDLAKQRKDLEEKISFAEQAEPWKPAMQRWNQLSPAQQKRIMAEFEADQAAQQEPEVDEEGEYLKLFDEKEHPRLRKLFELSEKRALKAYERLAKDREAVIQEQQQRLTQMEQFLQQRGQVDMTREVTNEIDRFHRECPEYNDLPKELQELFEDRYAGDLKRDRAIDVVTSFKKWHTMMEGRASARTQEEIDDLATRAERAPLNPSNAATGNPTPKQFGKGEKGRRAAFEHYARKQGIRV